MITQCQSCRSSALSPVLDLGSHPFSTGLPLRSYEPLRMFELALLQCGHCGLIQLRQPAAAEDLTPLVDWVTYREPENHLDDVCDRLAALPGLEDRRARILGVTSKDDSALARLSKHGFTGVGRLDIAGDLSVTRANANVEAVPEALTRERGAEIARSQGAAKLVIVRHIFEHAADLGQFIEGLKALVAPGGYLMLEVPDCTRSLALCDYTMIWEEHSVYFTPETFFNLLDRHGFAPALTMQYPYPYEDCLILVARRDDSVGAADPVAAPPRVLALGRDYGRRFDTVTQELREKLEAAKGKRPVALYGAGHLTASFVNYHGLGMLFDCVVDDTPQKQGLFLPGTNLPILPSAALLERGIGLCLLGLAPEVEPKIVDRNAVFIAGGGQFRSLLAASPTAFLRVS